MLILNPSEFFGNHEFNQNSCSLVKGKFHFFHYQCDGFNDQGWGCAYRAFQTISSWILLNTSNPTFKVPSISEIQAALVQMKDKPTNFVGSKDWIGSIEISLCLEHFCNISCKIIHLPPDFDWAS
eukprot:Sdes_comp18113_c0_seq1m7557